MAKLSAMCGIRCSYFLFFFTTLAVCLITGYYIYKTDFLPDKIKNYSVGEHRLHRRDAHIERKDTHLYYNSTITTDPEIGQSFWVDLKNNSKAKIHLTLSNSYRKAATINLSFGFPFYGYIITNVTITTGGFISTGYNSHCWKPISQYIAPLMADFAPVISNDSFVRYMDNGTAFTVEWEKLVLIDRQNEGEFTFQVTLHKNGDIFFVYKNMPGNISEHYQYYYPFTVGLSDRYVIERKFKPPHLFGYHSIDFRSKQISNWTAIYLTALPTCFQNQDCNSCITNVNPSFECYWCPNIKLCSSGTDRNRQAWLDNNCEVEKFNGSICSESTTLTITTSAPTTTPIAILTTTPTAIPSSAAPHLHTRIFDTCTSNHFQCNDICIPKSWICDGTHDCTHGEDEQHCDFNSAHASCSGDYFTCDGFHCHPLAYICDGNNDCKDGYDEANCTEHSRIYQVLKMDTDLRNSNETSLLLHWCIEHPFDVRLEFSPIIGRMGSYDWKKQAWTTDSYYRFNNLEPGTTYSMAVYVRIQNTSRVFGPAKYLVAQTEEAVIPGSPWNVTVSQKNESHLSFSWNPPKNPNDKIVNYQISWYPHKETKLKISGKVTSYLLKSNFQPDTVYSFYITAHNKAYESEKSNVVTLRFNEVRKKVSKVRIPQLFYISRKVYMDELCFSKTN